MYGCCLAPGGKCWILELTGRMPEHGILHGACKSGPALLLVWCSPCWLQPAALQEESRGMDSAMMLNLAVQVPCHAHVQGNMQTWLSRTELDTAAATHTCPRGSTDLMRSMPGNTVWQCTAQADGRCPWPQLA